MLFPFLRSLSAVLTSAMLFVSLTGATVSAQSMFDVMAKIDDKVVTRFEYEQRITLMQALRIPGNIEEEALKALINERLQSAAIARDGIFVENDALQDGIAEFAARAEMNSEDFLAALSQQGVAGQTFRDFVDVSLGWRQLIGVRFAPFVDISDVEIDRAITLEGTRGTARVQFSEIFLPTNSTENEALALELAPQIAALTDEAQFAEAARRFSAGESRTRGGRVEDWLLIDDLPPQIRAVLLTMKPGEVTNPIEIPNAIALFQLRAIAEAPAPRAPNMAIDYAAYYIAGGRLEGALQRAARLRNEVDTCDDLYGVAHGQPATVLDREKLPVSRIPRDFALELARLDSGEVSTALTRSDGQTLVFLMLCGRDREGGKELTEEETEAKREGIRSRLFNERVTSMADDYLSELRAEAVIVQP